MMTKKTIYEEVELYLIRSMGRYRTHLPHLWEDAIQEGLIQAWRDIEDGVEPKLKVMRRAALRSKNYFNRNGENVFGKAKKSRDGIRQNSTAIDKVTVFVNEFKPVHGRLPTGPEASQALGISMSAAGNALRHIKNGSVDHMRYREDGRMDWDYYSVISVQLLDGKEGVNNRSWEDNPMVRVNYESFEDDSVGNLDLIALMKKLAPKHQETLVLHLYHGYNTGDIGRHFKYENNISQMGKKALGNALNQIHILMDPYYGECTKGHERSESSTSVTRRVDGVYHRSCLTCKRGNAVKTNSK